VWKQSKWCEAKHCHYCGRMANMNITLKKKVTLSASTKRKFTDHQVKGVNGCVYWQLMFFDITKLFLLTTKRNGFVDICYIQIHKH
jgi:hypothetical protein